ncbi:mannose-6-phosphate isomerase-like protein (cupin superfamily) [Flavobacterium sp. PL12]
MIRILVDPKGRLSYQYHFKRLEVWTVVAGTAIITLDGIEKDYNIGNVAIIPQGMKHHVENRSSQPLLFLEVK